MSNNIYIAYYFSVKPIQPATEILIAELGFAGFESFVETETGVTAYIQKADWFETILDDIQILNSSEFKIEFTFEDVEQTNSELILKDNDINKIKTWAIFWYQTIFLKKGLYTKSIFFILVVFS